MAANTLNRQFTVTEPNRICAGDNTDIWTAAGWVYLAVVIGLYSHAVIGCAVTPLSATILRPSSRRERQWLNRASMDLGEGHSASRAYSLPPFSR